MKIANRYRLLKLVGVGGMGIVWLALDEQTGERVAVKAPRITGDPVRDRINVSKLYVEAEVLRVLNHEAIPRFVDFLVVHGTPYLVMEFVDGEELGKIFTPPLDTKTIVRIFEPIARAVHHMHTKNVIHRDLRPKNVLVPRDGWPPKIVDFGTAKFFHTQLQEAGEAIVAPGGYTAPEQFRGVSVPQSDIWSLGAMLFYLATGKPPQVDLPGYPYNVARPPNPRKFVPDVDPRIVKVVSRAMDPDPAKRYPTALDMLRDLLGEAITRFRNPTITIFGEDIEVPVDRVIIGRAPTAPGDTTMVTTPGAPRQPEKPFTVVVDGRQMMILIHDPKRYVSRYHLELVRKEDGWYLRDLGSLNRTALLVEGRWIVVHAGHRRPSNPVKLGKDNIIALGYDDKLGPYITLRFRTEVEEESESEEVSAS